MIIDLPSGANIWWRQSCKIQSWLPCVSHLCKVKIVRVCLLSPQPHRDEDDDSSAVRQGGGGRWLVVLCRRRAVGPLRRGLPWFWRFVAIDDISTVHYGGSMKQRSDGGLLSVTMSDLSVKLTVPSSMSEVWLCFSFQDTKFFFLIIVCQICCHFIRMSEALCYMSQIKYFRVCL